MSRIWLTLAAVAGILLGIVTVLIWYFGNAPFIRSMIPFVIATQIVIVAVTALVSVKHSYFNIRSASLPEIGCCAIKSCTVVILITAALTILVGLAILATCLPFIFRTIFAFIGGISFWISLIAFIFYIICLVRRT